jgi:Inhibitor of Apoptosis domain.
LFSLTHLKFTCLEIPGVIQFSICYPFGKKDHHTICFHCGTQLGNWEVSDNPCVEHAKKEPYVSLCNSYKKDKNSFKNATFSSLLKKVIYSVLLKVSVCVNLLKLTTRALVLYWTELSSMLEKCLYEFFECYN